MGTLRQKPLSYLEIVNDSNFREANRLVHEAEYLLMKMGLTLEEAREWVRAWVSGAGDGSE